MNSSRVSQAGAPAKAYRPLVALASKSSQQHPGWFNVASNFSAATEAVLTTQKRIFTTMGNKSTWADVTGEDVAGRMLKVAALCARAGEHGEAVELLECAQEREPYRFAPQTLLCAQALVTMLRAPSCPTGPCSTHTHTLSHSPPCPTRTLSHTHTLSQPPSWSTPPLPHAPLSLVGRSNPVGRQTQRRRRANGRQGCEAGRRGWA